MTLEVIDPGVLSTVQDLGRLGFTADAVCPSGAADLPAHRLANRLVGNAERCATVEAVLGTLRLRALADTVIAVTGAPVPVIVGGHSHATGQAISVAAGEPIELGWAEAGLRSYVAVRGGVAVAPVLGSRSTDTISGLGPAPLEAGHILPIGNDVQGLPAPDHVPIHPIEASPVLDITSGPRIDWIDGASRTTLGTQRFAVSDKIDRIGVRLTGPRLVRSITRELPSEAIIVGAVQLPPNGDPIIFGPDHPTTGGYPVVAVVAERHLHVVAQLRPGQNIRFRWKM
jgi:biotin-dependent carboxylase-like uncharacterized protein